ncbi:MAG TPA: glutathione S-transferase family protein [Candidatus Sulfotelmatobacter sp.]|nr:glutathione S-transferase family protein [Candidatus Sulfotelmatobacter sp.]
MATSGFTLYGFWLSGPSYKAALMLALCGIKFGYKSISLQQGAHKTPEYLALNRYGQVPTLKHGEHAIVQSNVILDYLSELAGKFRGHDKASVVHAKEWLAWEADRLAPNVYRTRFYKRFAPNTDPNVVKVFADAADVALKVLDGALAKGPFLVGKEASIADIACWAPVAFLEEAGMSIDLYPNVKAWAERLGKLPGFKLPYDLMPKEDVAA